MNGRILRDQLVVLVCGRLRGRDVVSCERLSSIFSVVTGRIGHAIGDLERASSSFQSDLQVVKHIPCGRDGGERSE